ncbi:MAG: hypothetical protein MJ085_03330 [Clostridia bacterium]|nr:hypothetical protein [Clostridia bacterium]
MRCPLYLKDCGTRLNCEGITDECTLQLNFHTKNAKDQQIAIFCRDRYRNCELYEAIMKAKYADQFDAEQEALHGSS